MRTFLLSFLVAPFLLSACGGGGQGQMAPTDAGDSTVSDARPYAQFIGVSDTLFVGTWQSADADSAVLTLQAGGEAQSHRTADRYRSWRQTSANELVLTRDGHYGGTLSDTADVAVEEQPMRLTIRRNGKPFVKTE